ncbi:glutathione S-transferase-like isoform X2 [Hyposmocoma kahamanoa]|uniref:glutathione S-transferase-like isoform X2 n=1 Tax=Hyposmocoma kahamanoa TaxID=1477025 RepID=UPI000E6D8823|nr:glutathione S-transferase-like isoform X2 [Hyposmocoma kahamanoa]
MAQKLHYFDLNVYAEAIRYMLYYSGDKFEDVRHDRHQWPIQDVKDKLPYGKMPFYEEGNRSVDQSLAIARYVANKYNLLPSNPWDQAVLDAVVLHIYDFFSKAYVWYKEPDPARKDAMKKDIMEVQIDFYFSKFDKELKKNKGHFGGRLYWADFILVGIVEVSNLALGIEIEKKYPAVQVAPCRPSVTE